MPQTPEDEWFDPPAAGLSPAELQPPTEDNWLASDEPLPRTTFNRWFSANQRLVVAAGIAAVFLLAILAVLGVFSSGSAQPATPVLTTTTPPVTSTKTPAAQSIPSPPTTTLKPGDNGPQVKALQRELASLGYSVGAIDGNYGPATTREVAAFQRADRLTADGIVGPATLLALAP